jgi:hypothetical protein
MPADDEVDVYSVLRFMFDDTNSVEGAAVSGRKP